MNIVKVKKFEYVLDWFEVTDIEIDLDKYSGFEFQYRCDRWYLMAYKPWDGSNFPLSNLTFQLSEPKEAAKTLGNKLSTFSFLHGVKHSKFAEELSKILA